MPTKNYPVVALNRFIEATRDSGYKTTASAVAELIDNAFEAKATKVEVSILEANVDGTRQLTVVVRDNGCGMPPSVLRLALQFGGSTRFNSREGVGRYGMGLPNSSLSQARRLDVYSWTNPARVYWSYLDVDQIAAGKLSSVPKPLCATKNERPSIDSSSGTVVRWSRCDRLNHKKAKTVAAKLDTELGRSFRRQILAGKSITINGIEVKSNDPLFLNEGENLVGATAYGPPLQYQITVPVARSQGDSSAVTVTFSALPVAKWHSFSNEEKRRFGISKGAGVSIIRANREIDHGWFFMGGKRKENYDDWWRCEVRFDAALDELFGVTHNKQGIHPTDELLSILTPDIEKIAHELNASVRSAFTDIKGSDNLSGAQALVESRDYLLEPPIIKVNSMSRYGMAESQQSSKQPRSVTLPGLSYRIEHKVLKELSFYVPVATEREVVLLLNEDHPFYERIYAPIACSVCTDVKSTRQYLEILLFAAARAECAVRTKAERACAGSLRESWSNVLAAFLG